MPTPSTFAASQEAFSPADPVVIVGAGLAGLTTARPPPAG
jgi:monoamine oxidase